MSRTCMSLCFILLICNLNTAFARLGYKSVFKSTMFLELEQENTVTTNSENNEGISSESQVLLTATDESNELEDKVSFDEPQDEEEETDIDNGINFNDKLDDFLNSQETENTVDEGNPEDIDQTRTPSTYQNNEGSENEESLEMLYYLLDEDEKEEYDEALEFQEEYEDVLDIYEENRDMALNGGITTGSEDIEYKIEELGELVDALSEDQFVIIGDTKYSAQDLDEKIEINEEVLDNLDEGDVIVVLDEVITLNQEDIPEYEDTNVLEDTNQGEFQVLTLQDVDEMIDNLKLTIENEKISEDVLLQAENSLELYQEIQSEVKDGDLVYVSITDFSYTTVSAEDIDEYENPTDKDQSEKESSKSLDEDDISSNDGILIIQSVDTTNNIEDYMNQVPQYTLTGTASYESTSEEYEEAIISEEDYDETEIYTTDKVESYMNTNSTVITEANPEDYEAETDSG